MLLLESLKKNISICKNSGREFKRYNDSIAVFPGLIKNDVKIEALFANVFENDKKLTVTIDEKREIHLYDDFKNNKHNERSYLMIKYFESMKEDKLNKLFWDFLYKKEDISEFTSELPKEQKKLYFFLLNISNIYNKHFTVYYFEKDEKGKWTQKDDKFQFTDVKDNIHLEWNKRSRGVLFFLYLLYPFYAIIDFITFPLQLFIFKGMVK